MIEDGRIPGIWWISDEPDNKVPGDLLINDGRLELNGSFQPLQPGAYDVRTPGLIRPVQKKQSWDYHAMEISVIRSNTMITPHFKCHGAHTMITKWTLTL